MLSYSSKLLVNKAKLLNITTCYVAARSSQVTFPPCNRCIDIGCGTYPCIHGMETAMPYEITTLDEVLDRWFLIYLYPEGQVQAYIRTCDNDYPNGSHSYYYLITRGSIVEIWEQYHGDYRDRQVGSFPLDGSSVQDMIKKAIGSDYVGYYEDNHLRRERYTHQQYRTIPTKGLFAGEADFPSGETWRGPGYYGPVQSGNHTRLVFVCGPVNDITELDLRKKTAGIMTVRYFAKPPKE